MREVISVKEFSEDWKISDFAEKSVEKYREKIGDKKAICALSGGVDSAVCAALISKAIGKNLTCILVDHGLMRKNEADDVIKVFKENYDVDIIKLDREDYFLSKLKGVTDPEKKRKIIGEEFIRVFEEEAKKLGKIDFLVQGTIYPDIVESGAEGHKAVKSHHNVGGLPEDIGFEGLIEPLRDLYKDEVRQVGLSLGLPERIVRRQPFPGPGLGVRVLGELTKEKLDLLREADFIFRDEIAKAGLAYEISQYFAILTNLKSVGVSEDERTYEKVIALRAVNTENFMTATVAKVPFEVLQRAAKRITDEIKEVNRVVFDITSKPPATVEWE